MKWDGAYSHSFAWHTPPGDLPERECVVLALLEDGHGYDEPLLSVAGYAPPCTAECEYAMACMRDEDRLCEGGFSDAFQGGLLPVERWSYVPRPRA